MIEFTAHRSSIMNPSEQDFILSVFKQMNDRFSYYTNLQLIYNNSSHYRDAPIDICTFSQIKTLAKTALSSRRKLIVNGTTHHFNHVSGILYDANTNHGLFTQDSYIKVIDETGNKYHILINPPMIDSSPINYHLYPSHHCDTPYFIIPPYFSKN